MFLTEPPLGKMGFRGSLVQIQSSRPVSQVDRVCWRNADIPCFLLSAFVVSECLFRSIPLTMTWYRAPGVSIPAWRGMRASLQIGFAFLKWLFHGCPSWPPHHTRPLDLFKSMAGKESSSTGLLVCKTDRAINLPGNNTGLPRADFPDRLGDLIE